MAHRPFWRGHLKLSLVSCPVALHSALTEQNDIRLNFINPETGNRIRNQVVDAETGAELERGDLVRGYQFAKDRYVTLTDEELDELKIESSSVMEIETFVPAADIPTIYFDKPYYIVPDGDAGQEAFAVVREAMAKAGMFAVTRVVLARKERVIALHPQDRGIVAYSLREAADIKPAAEYFDDIDKPRVDRSMLDIAMKLVEQKTGAFTPDAYEDRYEARMRQLIDAKLKGVELEPAAAPEEPANVVNLMDALKRSLEGGGKRPARKDSGSATVHKLPARPKAAKKPAKRAPRKPAKKRASR